MQAAFNLLVCSYALGDKEGMMGAFQRLLTVPGLADCQGEEGYDSSDADNTDDEDATAETGEAGLGDSILSLKARFQDGLRDAAGVTDQMKQHQRQQMASMTR